MRAYEVSDATGGVLNGNRDAEYQNVCIDSRACAAGSLFVAISGEKHDGNSFLESAFQNGCAVAIGTKDFEAPRGKAYIKVKDSILALGALASWHRAQYKIPVVGITGSVGKTTTKEMIAAVLSQKYNTLKTEGNYNNHIGLPLTALRLSDEHTAAVIEMGMSARGEIAALTRIARPTVAVITNVGMSHIESLGTVENIRDAKLEIIEGLSPGGTLLINGDDAQLRDVVIDGVHIVRYGFQNPACDYCGEIVDDSTFIWEGQSVHVPVGGIHNLYNALAACAVGSLCGIDKVTAARGIMDYAPDGIRQTETKIRDGVLVICDYYNAGPASMEAAINMLQKGKALRRIAVLGDMLELGAYSQQCHQDVGRLLAKGKIDAAFFVGKEMKKAAETAREGGVLHVSCFEDNASLSDSLIKILRAGDRVLIKGSHGMRMQEIFEKIR